MPRFLFGISLACLVSGIVHQVWHSPELSVAVGAFTAISIWFRALEFLWDAGAMCVAAALGGLRD
ncbi:hypothetical protein ABZS76_33010 [Streptomyces sp. NPDC005562]|uniref:hypothetical protein n=1 Tax=Streptomyces sp. NPDC005562 TaxID=3154890 RepID=UPI0033BC2325